jgi:hypothetical protein
LRGAVTRQPAHKPGVGTIVQGVAVAAIAAVLARIRLFRGHVRGVVARHVVRAHVARGPIDAAVAGIRTGARFELVGAF